MNIAVHNKQLWMGNAIIVTSLIAAAFFPTDNGFQSAFSNIAFLIILPLLFIRFFSKKQFSDFGIGWGDVSQGMFWLVACLVGVIAASFGVYRYTDMFSQMNIPLIVRSSFPMFLVYVAGLGIFLAAQEFFFRGFVLNVWRDAMGCRSILIQGMFSIIPPLLRTHGVFGSDTLLVAALSLCSGWIAFRSRSIWYPFFFFFISVILGISIALVFAQ